MATATVRRVYWGFLTVGFVLVSSLASSAQAGSPAASPRDLTATLAELSRVAPATIQDLDVANQQQGGLLHRVTFWRGNKGYDGGTAKALRRNLQVAVPNLIQDTQASGGSLATSFRLYRDLTEVCDTLRSLLPPGSRDSKPEFAALNHDLSDISRLNEEVYSHLERRAAAIDNRTAQLPTSSGRSSVRVIVDNDLPDSAAPKKRHPSSQ